MSLFSSMHTHTVFCDGKDDIETMCRAAFEKKLYAIGFSAHAPVSRQLGVKTDWHLSEERLDQYVNEVLEAKKRWDGKILVFLGLEVDFIKGIRSVMDSDIRALNLDYIIGAAHYIIPPNGTEPFTVDAPLEEFEKGFKEGFGGDGEAFMHCYYDTVAEMIKLGGFEILAHADIIKKNCQDKNYWSEKSELNRQMEITRLIAKTNITVEVNTGGINRKKTRDVYPSLPFLRLLCEYNIPVIITSDAHCAENINGNYDIALQTLISAGFKEHFLFSGEKNEKKLWKKEKII